MEAEAGQDTARLFKTERKMLKAMTKPEKMVHNHLQMVGLDVPFEQAYPDLSENYRAVIAHPMDLGTIKRRLKDHSVYKLCNQPVHPDFIRDVTLVWKNCMQYNPPGHPYHEFSKLKLASFERKVRERCSPTTKKDSATAASVAGCEDTSAAPRSKPKLTLGGRGGDGGGGGDGGAKPSLGTASTDIGCDSCDRWYKSEDVGLSAAQCDALETWHCPKCRKKDGPIAQRAGFQKLWDEQIDLQAVVPCVWRAMTIGGPERANGTPWLEDRDLRTLGAGVGGMDDLARPLWVTMHD